MHSLILCFLEKKFFLLKVFNANSWNFLRNISVILSNMFSAKNKRLQLFSWLIQIGMIQLTYLSWNLLLYCSYCIHILGFCFHQCLAHLLPTKIHSVLLEDHPGDWEFTQNNQQGHQCWSPLAFFFSQWAVVSWKVDSYTNACYDFGKSFSVSFCKT